MEASVLQNKPEHLREREREGERERERERERESSIICNSRNGFVFILPGLLLLLPLVVDFGLQEDIRFLGWQNMPQTRTICASLLFFCINTETKIGNMVITNSQ